MQVPAAGLVLGQVLMVTAHWEAQPFKGNGISLALPALSTSLKVIFLGSSTEMSPSTPAVGQSRTEPPRDGWSILPVLTSPALE